ncbi:hypothetical protein IF1G_02755 [Cordyceps javanica]|uniref:Uncharacterized protein n=1 Tax=Cordyceps javanica TaxID=43265 RepID=A0A545VAC5_9HYPO|nr:hypothetical protein IF1G_02755 [Cordyceps javanica]
MRSTEYTQKKATQKQIEHSCIDQIGPILSGSYSVRPDDCLATCTTVSGIAPALCPNTDDDDDDGNCQSRGRPEDEPAKTMIQVSSSFHETGCGCSIPSQSCRAHPAWPGHERVAALHPVLPRGIWPPFGCHSCTCHFHSRSLVMHSRAWESSRVQQSPAELRTISRIGEDPAEGNAKTACAEPHACRCSVSPPYPPVPRLEDGRPRRWLQHTLSLFGSFWPGTP